MPKTKDNKYSRKQIAKICQDNDWRWCVVGPEIKNYECLGEANAPAHRHKKRDYAGLPIQAMYDVNQWLPCCQSCHHIIEYDRELSNRVFNNLRGNDKYVV